MEAGAEIVRVHAGVFPLVIGGSGIRGGARFVVPHEDADVMSTITAIQHPTRPIRANLLDRRRDAGFVGSRADDRCSHETGRDEKSERGTERACVGS
jgi:hypothetical protein